jgi:hypothetical protein
MRDMNTKANLRKIEARREFEALKRMKRTARENTGELAWPMPWMIKLQQVNMIMHRKGKRASGNKQALMLRLRHVVPLMDVEGV